MKHRRDIFCLATIALCLQLVSGMVVKDSPNAQILTTAIANIYRANEYGVYSHGTITFEQVKDGGSLHVRIRGRLKSIEPIDQGHAFIIHDGPASYLKACSELGGHFNPQGTHHGAPNEPAKSRHVGDLGNIYVNRFGFADINTNDDLIQIGTQDSSFDVVGKTLAIHYLPDDFGRTDNNTVRTVVADSGAIIACGNIETQSLSSSALATHPLNSGIFFIFISLVLLFSC